MPFNVLFTDLFSEANGLLDTVSPGNWLLVSGFNPAYIVSQKCTAGPGGPPAPSADEQLIAISPPADQWAAVTLSVWNLSSSVAINFYMRSSGPASGYGFRATSNGNGTTATVRIFDYTSLTTLYNNATLAVAVGDTFLFACQGTTLSVYHNGTLLGSVTNSDIASGEIILNPTGYTTAQTDLGLTNFQTGNFSTYSIGGNAGVAGATVSWVSGAASGSVTVDGSGNYSITGLVNGTYTITPSKAGYVFSPTNASKTVSNANITGVNFTATPTLNYLIEDWMWVTPFTEQIDGINDTNLPMTIRIGFAALVKMQVTYRIFLHNKGSNSPGSNAHIWNNPAPQWQQAMVARQQAQTPGFAAIYASAPLLPNPTPPFVYPTY